jgi:hypothetical protein
VKKNNNNINNKLSDEIGIPCAGDTLVRPLQHLVQPKAVFRREGTLSGSLAPTREGTLIRGLISKLWGWIWCSGSITSWEGFSEVVGSKPTPLTKLIYHRNTCGEHTSRLVVTGQTPPPTIERYES